MVLDYLLCFFLLKNDLVRFLTVFDECYIHSSQEIPEAYHEALTLIAAMGKTDIRNYTVDKSYKIRFQKFNNFANHKNDVELKKRW